MASRNVLYLSLFSGACGGDLAMQHLLGFRCAGYVEIESYCQKIIAQRIKDGCLDEAPIFGDIREFINQGYAQSYQGMVDGITAGFPCQPFSVAGKRAGEKDKRNLWPETIECIRIIRPQFAFLENVPGLLAHPYVRRIFGDLAKRGYNARWCMLGADNVGAPHRRKRLWILAHTNDASRNSEQRSKQEMRAEQFGRSSKIGSTCLAYPQCKRLHERYFSQERQATRRSWKQCRWWEVEPRLGRVAHGVAYRVERLKALGNGQVPAVAATAWRVLAAGGEP